jgi:hypothetical protein
MLLPEPVPELHVFEVTDYFSKFEKEQQLIVWSTIQKSIADY